MNYNLGNYNFENDPEIQKMIEEQMRRKGQFPSPELTMPELGGQVPQSPGFDVPQFELDPNLERIPEGNSKYMSTDDLYKATRSEGGNLSVDDLTSAAKFRLKQDPRQMEGDNEKLRQQLRDKMLNRDADKQDYEKQLKTAGENAAPSGWQKGAGIIASALQGMATKGSDLSLASKLKQGWDKDVKTAEGKVRDPAADTKAILDDYIKMKALERGDKSFDQQKELKQMDLTAAEKRLKEQRGYDETQTAKNRDYKETTEKTKLNEELATPFGLARTKDDAKKIKEANETKVGFDRKIQELIDLREKYGVEFMNREAVARGKQLSKELLLAYKNMAKLGVLSKSDEDIINAVIPGDPLGMSIGSVTGQDDILESFKKFQKDVNNDFEDTLGTRLKNPEASNSVTPPKGGTSFPMQIRKDGKIATVSNAQELEEAKAEGWK